MSIRNSEPEIPMDRRVPQELCEQILDAWRETLGWKPSGMHSASLVCRAWLPRSRTLIFREIVVDLDLDANVFGLASLLKSTPDISHLIREIHVLASGVNHTAASRKEPMRQMLSALRPDRIRRLSLEGVNSWTYLHPLIIPLITPSLESLCMTDCRYKRMSEFLAFVEPAAGSLRELRVTNLIMDEQNGTGAQQDLQEAVIRASGLFTGVRILSVRCKPRVRGHNAQIQLLMQITEDLIVKLEHILPLGFQSTLEELYLDARHTNFQDSEWENFLRLGRLILYGNMENLPILVPRVLERVGRSIGVLELRVPQSVFKQCERWQAVDLAVSQRETKLKLTVPPGGREVGARNAIESCFPLTKGCEGLIIETIKPRSYIGQL